MLSDMMPVLRVPYYRFNPPVPALHLDETAPEILRKFQQIGREHVTCGRGKEDCVALARLLTGRSPPLPPATRLRPPRSWPGALLMRLGSRVASVRSRL